MVIYMLYSRLMENIFPVRINKYIAHKGYTTRRGADELIEKGYVFINKKPAVIGQMVEANDIVEIRGHTHKTFDYIAFNKPKGVVTHSPQKYEKEIKDILDMKGVFPIGRLDKNSHGLMILTNDGRVTDKLLNPDYKHDKEYIVTTKLKLRSSFKEKMEAGVQLEDYKTKPAKIVIVDENTFRITLTEGKRHQIKRMVVALFNEVTDLKRIRIMNINLGRIRSGAYRRIEGAELEGFLGDLGIT